MSTFQSHSSTRWVFLSHALTVVSLSLLLAGCQEFSDESPVAGAAVEAGSAADATTSADEVAEPASSRTQLPKLLDLGATKCIPCKMMAPILDELRDTYEGKMEVVFIDVWENSEEAAKYGIEQIPTQIFFDATGKERFRHVGFYSREEIMAKWKELGVDLKS